MSATDWLLLVTLSVLWGGSFFFAKVAVLELPPLTVALGRVAIAAAMLLAARAHDRRRAARQRGALDALCADGPAQQRRCRSA